MTTPTNRWALTAQLRAEHPRDDPASERILGASVVGAEAGELIHVFAALMQAGATGRAIVDTEAVHPSFAEGVQAVVMALPPVRAVLRRVERHVALAPPAGSTGAFRSS